MVESDRCTGCGACKQVCPVNAIEMKIDEHGFLQPLINNHLCIHCSQCEKVCPVSEEKVHSQIHSCTIAYSRDDKIRQNSSSGGMFALFAQIVFENEGVVFGCTMSKDCKKAEHVMITNQNELIKLMGSKYLQSDTSNSFVEVKNMLKAGKTVLFSGTPCQIAGLKTFLRGKNIERLYTIDFICHGVPSPLVWKKFIENIENNKKEKVINTYFRSKTFGWKQYSLVCEFLGQKTYISPINENLYLQGFLANMYLRDSCSSCPFKDENYYSDITMADCWGVDTIVPEYNDNKGVSLILTHNEQGEELLTRIKEKINFTEADAGKVLVNNISYYQASKMSACSKYFWKDFKTLPIDKVLEKYVGKSLGAKIRRKIICLFDKKPVKK